MAKSTSTPATSLQDRLDRLASFAPQSLPVISLYLNLAPDQHGRDNYDSFVRKAFAERVKAFPLNTPERASFDRDVDRITTYLADEVNQSANGVAVFACAGADDFFDALQLEVPVADHWVFVSAAPHLYPLALLADQYPRYASVVLDTHRARILVFGLGAVERREEVTGVKTRRHSMGGWSQARYQRRAENVQLDHIKEVVEVLDNVVRNDNIQHVIVAGDDVVVPMLREQLPQHLRDKLVDVLRLERDATEADIVEATLEALRQKDEETDEARVEEVVGAWQGSGLGAVGPEAVLSALERGQVDELLIAGSPDTLKPVQKLPADATPGAVDAATSAAGQVDERRIKLSDELVTRAQQTGARVRVIEDASLLEPYGGVGAALRYRL